VYGKTICICIGRARKLAGATLYTACSHKNLGGACFKMQGPPLVWRNRQEYIGAS
jgi:hypothetical protein